MWPLYFERGFSHVIYYGKFYFLAINLKGERKKKDEFDGEN
jgi:hypothetical protein